MHAIYRNQQPPRSEGTPVHDLRYFRDHHQARCFSSHTIHKRADGNECHLQRLRAQIQPGGLVLFFHPTDTVRSSAGIGDAIFRVKDAVWKGEASGLSTGADLRVPSGDELNLRGSGTTGFHPFGAFSYRRKYLSPHVNLGYQVNGSSVLAAQTNTPKHLPNSLTYAGGVDVRVLRSLGLNLDLVGQTSFGQQTICIPSGKPILWSRFGPC